MDSINFKFLIRNIIRLGSFFAILAIWKYLRYDIYPKRTGFICQDPNLSYPYRNSTIADKWLFIIGFGVPILVWILEFFLTKSSDLKKKFKKSSFLAWKWIFYFAYIIFSMDCLIEIIKNFAGVHRPYFFDVCNPDLAVNCTKGTYVNSDYECQNKNLQKMLLSHSEKSFPSGHASSTTFSCLYFMWYIHMRLSKSKILRSFVNLICLIWIAVCCTSRVTDYWHRAIDIIAGIIIAIPFAFYLCYVLCNNFDRKIKLEPKENVDLSVSVDDIDLKDRMIINDIVISKI